MTQVIMFTDGAASGNPGPGGFGTLMIYGQHKKEISKGFELTTNNRMELMAVIEGLKALTKEGCDVVVYTDSKYVADSVSKGWVFNWQRNRFHGKKNSDLWMEFLNLYNKHKIKFIWVKGHSNVPENEYCDKLAVAASKSSILLKDVGYVNSL